MLRQDVEKWPLDQWQSMFSSIYSRRNARYSVQDVVFRLLEEVGELVYPIKQLDLKTIRWQLPDVLAWLCTLISTIDAPKISTVLWNKFNNGCPRCHVFKDCKCPDIIEALEAQGAPRTQGSSNLFSQAEPVKPKTMDDWQVFFLNLYGKRNASMDPLILVARLVEDVGAI